MTRRISMRETPNADYERMVFGAELDGSVPSIDLHGMTTFEITPDLDRFIDRSFRQLVPVVGIIHGRGTGRLREAVHAYLRSHPHVVYFRDAEALHAQGAITYAVLDA